MGVSGLFLLLTISRPLNNVFLQIRSYEPQGL